MAKGRTGTVLRVNLGTGEIHRWQPEADFYRMYLGGGAFGSYFLLKETSGDTDALDPGNVITIAPGVATGAPVSGVSRCCITALSPATGAVGDSQVGGNIGPMIKRAGYDAIVITGRAPELCYLLVQGDQVAIRPAEHLRGKLVLEVHDALGQELGAKNLCILQCGPAGENMVRFACVVSDLNDVAGRTGMGAVLGSKNLRAVVVQGTGTLDFADADGLKELSRKAAARLEGVDFLSTLRKYGTPGLVGPQGRAGNLSTRNYSRSFHPDFEKLDGASFEPQIGAGETTCFACVVKCRKKVRAEQPYRVTDRLGGPEFETLGLLGTNLDITDPVAVAKANELCNNYGIDTITLGGLAGYLFECVQEGIIRPKAVDGRALRFGDVEGLFWLIEKVAKRDGIGDVLADGFSAAIKKFGKRTAPFAIHVKNHGLAAHMPQVKPSQALTYAVSPIGADHMSSEHDWLLGSDSEARTGLGIVGRGDANSTNIAKVRMTVYSQYYYSALDALCLCMFCWAPGSLFSYRELENLVRCATGWECTFWELMKAGERRVNMMRQINKRRGFTKKHDRLPARLSEPLPDGPRKGSHVDTQAFGRMQEQYYALMGWDGRSGNPTTGKLMELGLEWTMQSEDPQEA